jgi:hypothetical protein
MTSRFALRERRASATIDREYAERTRILPRVAGTYMVGVGDNTRAELDVLGIVDLKPVVARIKDKAEYDAFRPELQGDVAHVSYDVGRFASVAEYPREKDHIVLLDRGNEKYQIVDVDPDGLGRILCRCVVAK